jgi:hypothetical protein
VTQLYYPLILALLGLGCAGPPRSVAAKPTTPAAPAPEPAVPADARAVYVKEDGALLGLVAVDGRILLVSPEAAAPTQIEEIVGGYVLRPARSAEPPESAPRIPFPESLRLQPPVGDAGWQLDAGSSGRFAELRDPWAKRLSAGLDSLELVRVDTRAFEALGRLAHYLHLLRDPTPEELAESVSSIDPELVKSKGGVRVVVAEQLMAVLESLRPALSSGELVELERYIETARRVAYDGGELWSPGDDAFLTGRTVRLSRTEDTVAIRDGALMRVDTKEPDGTASCDLGVMLPEPTENHGRPWSPFVPPARGKLGAFTYVMFVLQKGPRGSCEQLGGGAFAYPVLHGVYYLRLFADAQARVQGAQFIGYMASELYVREGTSGPELMAMLRANAEELSHQAE